MIDCHSGREHGAGLNGRESTLAVPYVVADFAIGIGARSV